MIVSGKRRRKQRPQSSMTSAQRAELRLKALRQSLAALGPDDHQRRAAIEERIEYWSKPHIEYRTGTRRRFTDSAPGSALGKESRCSPQITDR